MVEFNRLLNTFVVSFFKRELMGEESYETYLNADFAAGEPAIGFSIK